MPCLRWGAVDVVMCPCRIILVVLDALFCICERFAQICSSDECFYIRVSIYVTIYLVNDWDVGFVVYVAFGESHDV